MNNDFEYPLNNTIIASLLANPTWAVSKASGLCKDDQKKALQSATILMALEKFYSFLSSTVI